MTSAKCQNLNDLLDMYAQKADLSEKTKRESAGFLQIYTRQDLERMQIRQLKEIIDKIPFFHYREDNYGLSNPFYIPYQPSLSNGLVVYINDRALPNVLINDGLKLYGQLDLEFIDHIEVYLGVPSLSFGIETGAVVIKLYTRNPAREETSLVGIHYGSRGANQLYYENAKTTDDGYNYLTYANYSYWHRQQVESPANTILKRDHEFFDSYIQTTFEHNRFEAQIVKGSTDAFLGESFEMDSIDPNFDFNYLYGGWYYDNSPNGLKAYLNFSQTKTQYSEQSNNSPIGLLPNSDGKLFPLFSKHYDITEQLTSAYISQKWHIDSLESLNGLQLHHKKFQIKEAIINNLPYNSQIDFDHQTIFSLFTENNYMLDRSNLFSISAKVDRYINAGKVNDQTLKSGRAGYIFNNKFWTIKSFLYYGETMPSMLILFQNREIFHRNYDPEPTKGVAVAMEATYHKGSNRHTLMFGRSIWRNMIFFNTDTIGPYYDNIEDDYIMDTVRYFWDSKLSSQTETKWEWWASYMHNNSNLIYKKAYGGLIALDQNFGNITLHNDLVYKYFPGNSPGLNWNASINYNYSRQLSFHIKATNILNRAIKQNYYTINPLPNPENPTKTTLNDIDIFEPTVWVGLEYQF